MGAGQESKNIRYVQAGVSNISLEDDVINCDSSQGVITLLLPNINGSGILYNTKTFSINDFSGTATTNNIEIVGIGGNKINDASVLTISTNGESGKIFVLSQNDYLYEGNSSGGGGSAIVTAPFTPTNSTIIVGDDFQEVAEKAQGQINASNSRITILENNERKIIYYSEINASSGTITKPVGSTILLDQFYGGVDAFVSTISGGKPTGDFPTTAGGVVVDVTSFDASGNFVLSGTPSAYPCALIYTIKISNANYQNIDLNFVIEEPPLNSTLQNAYDANPEIETDSTRGAVTVKRGSLADTDDVFEVLNGSGVKTAYIKGNGDAYFANLNQGSLQFALDGNGADLIVGANAIISSTTNAGTITNWYIEGEEASGSIVIDVQRWNGASFVSIIGAGNKPTISVAKFASASVSGWTSTTLAKNDRIRFVIDSVSGFSKCNLQVFYTKS